MPFPLVAYALSKAEALALAFAQAHPKPDMPGGAEP